MAVQSSAPSFPPVPRRAHIRRPIKMGQMTKKTAAGMYTRCALLASGSNGGAVSVPAMPGGHAQGRPRALLVVRLALFPPRRARAACMSVFEEAVPILEIAGGRKGRKERAKERAGEMRAHFSAAAARERRAQGSRTPTLRYRSDPFRSVKEITTLQRYQA
ncbi:hypothetical protein VTG60DRAFT_5792 [Thermothelomyces hinnuleus]